MNKSGFGLIEVLAAAVVLAFLLVGLSLMQRGNRESILRVRARDAANVVAQDVIDSISALGSASVSHGAWSCDEGAADGTPERVLCKERIFTGTASRLLRDTLGIRVPYRVEVVVRDESHLQMPDPGNPNGCTAYLDALGACGGGGSSINARHQFAKQVDVTVNWKFKNSDQSVNVSSVVR